MPEDQYRWFNVDKADSEDCNFSDEKFVSCQLTKIFHYSEKRNAIGTQPLIYGQVIEPFTIALMSLNSALKVIGKWVPIFLFMKYRV